MYPRLCFDIGWRDLSRALGYCLRSTGNSRLPLDAACAGESLVALSVRSAFDLLLSALDLPAGSQVLLSEVTVPHMSRIVREHGLTPAAVPVDPRTLHVSAEDVAQRITPQTKVLVVAHLFGTRMPLGDLGQLCRDRGVLLVEDCAQAFVSGCLQRDSAADVSLYSFGPIKTATALGGAVALVRDAELRQRMQQVAAAWPMQPQGDYAARIAKIAWLKLLSRPALLSLLVGWLEATGRDGDAFVGHSARGFPDQQLFEHLRQQPCSPLKRLIAWRLDHFDPAAVDLRATRGWQLSQAIQPVAYAAGCDSASHTWWVFPVVCKHPVEVVRELRGAGLDASQHSGIAVVGEAPPDHWFHRAVFVPHGVQVPQHMLDRAAEIICRVEAS